jgi:hypothetical protein
MARPSERRSVQPAGEIVHEMMTAARRLLEEEMHDGER